MNLKDRADEIAKSPHSFAGQDITNIIEELLIVCDNKRDKLPDRRPALTKKVIWKTEISEHVFHITFGFCLNTGKILEIFYADGQKTGSALQHTIQDACVLISLLLQHGVSPNNISKSLSNETVVGAIVAALCND